MRGAPDLFGWSPSYLDTVGAPDVCCWLPGYLDIVGPLLFVLLVPRMLSGCSGAPDMYCWPPCYLDTVGAPDVWGGCGGVTVLPPDCTHLLT
jgi:hypothetical protein